MAFAKQPEHQEQQAGARGVDERALQERVEAEEADLLQLQLEDAGVDVVEARDLLVLEAERLHQLDVAQRLGRRACELRGLRDDHPLLRLDPPADEEHQRCPAPAPAGDKRCRSTSAR